MPSNLDVPGSAEAGRLDADPDKILPDRPAPEIILPDGTVTRPQAPEDAKNITFTLKNVHIEGATVFAPGDLADIYTPFIGKEITLSRAWEFAGEVTERYRNKGYFLSRAYIPAQEIGKGEIKIEVIEGYIHEVYLENAEHENHVVRRLRERIKKNRPISVKKLENALLLLGDIPGVRFEAVLAPDDNLPDGAVNLIIRQEKTESRGNLRLDNHGSRFTGPHQTAFAYEDSLLPLQKTSLSAIASIPDGDELWAWTLRHEARILPEVTLLFELSETNSHPGFTLSQFDVESRSFSWNAGFNFQILRQRGHNLDAGLSLNYRNSDTDILNTRTTRDRVRAVRARLNYDGRDAFRGINIVNLTASRGLEGLGANSSSDTDLSRADADPDFTAFHARWERQQYIARSWLLKTTLAGQKASKALYASEEFGFGGPTLGRAYDISEIVGDDGVAGALELSYTGLSPLKDIKLTPSVFYDIGKIWNTDEGQPDGLSAASAGMGLGIYHPSGLNGRVTVALPLTKELDTPVQGNNGKNPRLFFQLGYAL